MKPLKCTSIKLIANLIARWRLSFRVRSSGWAAPLASSFPMIVFSDFHTGEFLRSLNRKHKPVKEAIDFARIGVFRHIQFQELALVAIGDHLNEQA